MSKYNFKKAGRLGGLAEHERRTHWPKGKRRNDPGISKQQLRGLLSDIWATSRKAKRGDGRSLLSLAQSIGVSDRTVRRWLSGVDLPPAVMVRRMQEWLSKHS